MAFGKKKPCLVCEEKDRTIARLEQENRELRDALISVKAGPNMLDKIREYRQVEADADDGEEFHEDLVVGRVEWNGEMVDVTAGDIRKRFHEIHGGGMATLQSTRLPE